MNSASLLFVVSPKLIPPLYFLTFITHSCSFTNAIVVGIRVNIKIKVEVKVEIEIKVKIKVRVKGCMYIFYSH